MSSNRTIAKNTLFLYFRMFFNMAISLYTSRVVLQVLGIEDFGIYNLVGGVVVLFSFLNNSMSAATQRFINYEKASKIVENVKKVFNISIVNHFLISLIVLVLAETVGLWFLNTKLNIPSDRMYAANVVYQMSVLTTVIDIIRVPYNGIILAYERMSYYAFMGIFETITKLFIVYLLVIFPDFDHLIFYGVLYLVVNLLTNVVFYLYCRKNFKEETSLKFYKDFNKTKELLTFSGWMLFGQVAIIGATQGLSMILNIFYGVVMNAALGIAGQVSGAVYGFVANFQVAFNPQIVQSYASGDFERNKKLILSTSKYSFFLIVILSAPILFFTHSILTIWLGNNLPDYVESFIQVVIFCSLLDALAGPFWMSAAAIGSIKEYNITLTIMNLCTLPLAYLLLKMGFSPVFAFWTKFFIYAGMQLFRFYFINKYLTFNRKDFIFYLLGIVLGFTFLLILLYVADTSVKYSLFYIAIGSIIIEAILIVMIWTTILNKQERALGLEFIRQKMRAK